jgi:dipeptidyl aminopeptidase/acylaminoacyl peptidase
VVDLLAARRRKQQCTVNRTGNTAKRGRALGAVGLLLVGLWWCSPPATAQGNPGQAGAHVDTGMLLKRNRQFAAAIEEFRAALRLDPGSADAHWGLAWCYVSVGKEEEAVAAFQAVIRLAPGAGNALEAARAIERLRLQRPDLEVPPGPPQTFVIALSLVTGNNADLWMADSEGALRHRLTSHPATDSQPAFAPDGRRLVFVSDRAGNRDLWILDTLGSSPHPLTTNPAADYSPTWSPRGNQIIFVSERSGAPELWAIDPDTGVETPLGVTSSGDLEPAWSPRGDWVAFISDQDGPAKVFLLDPVSSQPRKLLANTVPERHPVWAPQADYLYFTWSLEGNSQICRALPDGEGLEAVQPTPDNDRLWALSPEGAWLLLSSDRTGKPQLYLMARQGRQVKMIGTGSYEVLAAAASPWIDETVAHSWWTAGESP